MGTNERHDALGKNLDRITDSDDAEQRREQQHHDQDSGHTRPEPKSNRSTGWGGTPRRNDNDTGWVTRFDPDHIPQL